VRLASGLGVWLQARLQAHDGVDFRHAVGMSAAAAIEVAPAPAQAEPALAPRANESATAGDGTLLGHSRKLIEDTLAAHGGNISQAARQLGVSRGTLYRRLRSWQQDEPACPG
jgi:transcriptional regulator of acetoin/glycerol metabolism